jgi:hypothetical protein
MTLLAILLVLSVGSMCWTLRLVAADGYGDRPGPRSHDHEPVDSWRAGAWDA